VWGGQRCCWEGSDASDRDPVPQSREAAGGSAQPRAEGIRIGCRESSLAVSGDMDSDKVSRGPVIGNFWQYWRSQMTKTWEGDRGVN
jgi:hypothetical protein